MLLTQIGEPPPVVETRQVIDEGEATKGRAQAMAFHRVPNGPLQKVRGNFTLDEIVLGSTTDGTQPNFLVVQAREDHDGDIRGEGIGPFKGHGPLTVGEVQVQENEIDAATREAGQSRGELAHMLHLDLTIIDSGGGFLHPNEAIRLTFYKKYLHRPLSGITSGKGF
jgi:hypothetical protein